MPARVHHGCLSARGHYTASAYREPINMRVLHEVLLPTPMVSYLDYGSGIIRQRVLHPFHQLRR